MVVDGAGNLYIGDLYNDRIRKVDTTGKITTIARTGESGFSGDGGPAAEAQLSDPTGVAMDGAGNLYIAERDNQRIRKVDSAGTITTIAGTGVLSFGAGGGFEAASQALGSGLQADRRSVERALNHIRQIEQQRFGPERNFGPSRRKLYH